MSEPPNWVRMRADCNLEIRFKAVRSSIVERDIGEANGLPTVAGAYRFVLESEGAPHTFRVIKKPVQGAASRDPTVDFALRGNSVVVQHYGMPDDKRAGIFKMTAEWQNDESRCALFIDGKEARPWEVSKRALEPLFFPEGR